MVRFRVENASVQVQGQNLDREQLAGVKAQPKANAHVIGLLTF
jgi:hypothetical protein